MPSHRTQEGLRSEHHAYGELMAARDELVAALPDGLQDAATVIYDALIWVHNGLTRAELDAICPSWQGHERAKFNRGLEALLKSGIAVLTDGRYRLTGWQRHLPLAA